MKYLNLFTNCMPVRGFKRSMICDLQRHTYEFIPNSLYSILIEFNGKEIGEIKDAIPIEDHEILIEYFTFLEDFDFIFWTESHYNFPKINNEYKAASKITNAIIDIDEFSNFSFSDIAEQLDNLTCKALQIRIYTLKIFDELDDLLHYFDYSKLRSLELFLKFNPDITVADFRNLHKKHPRITFIVLHTSDTEKILYADEMKQIPILYTTERISDCASCGKISPNYFSINLNTFLESKKFNSCLNKKISIDINGNIKNCPSMKKSFGNIKETSLKEALGIVEFKDMWNINKDVISICKDCEYRHICTDCRAYIDDPSDIYSHPAKCSYNPYQAKWKGEDEYIPVTDMTEKQISKLKSTAN